ncbi:MAG: CRISPR-associated protein [Candidatus Azobacteroides sp.]|nr:CRISPR-associated protein [Candidatus Azobacteroides sp.]
MLINLSNHPSTKWSPQQLAATQVYDEIIDLSFPDVDPSGDDEYIQSLVNEYVDKIINNSQFSILNSQLTVHIMGEMTFTFSIVNALQNRGIMCIASTTERIALEENGLKTSEFRFVRFRKYK